MKITNLRADADLAHHLDRAMGYVAPPFFENSGIKGAGPELNVLARLERFFWLVQRTVELPFLIKANTGRFLNSAAPTLLARRNESSRELMELASLFQSFPQFKAAYSPHLAYAPPLALLFEHYFTHELSKCDCNRPGDLSESGLIEAEVFNQFVTSLRSRISRERGCLGAVLHNWRYGSEQRVKGLYGSLDGLFQATSNLTVFHLTLYPSGHKVSLSELPCALTAQRLKEVCAMRNRLLDRPRKKVELFEHRRGLIWSIVPSFGVDFYLHATLFFDTQGLIEAKKLNGTLETPLDMSHLPPEERRAVTFPEQVAEYLVKAVTGGKGVCRLSSQDDYLYGNQWVTGEIRAGSFARRQALYEALTMFARQRHFVRVKGVSEAQSFGTGWQAKPRRQRTPEAEARAERLREQREALGVKALTQKGRE